MGNNLFIMYICIVTIFSMGMSFNNVDPIYANEENNIIINNTGILAELNDEHDNMISTTYTYILKEYYYLEFQNKIEENNDKNILDRDLTLFDFNSVSVEDFNNHILSNSPSDSPFINNGEIFINIGKELGVNPYFIYAHACVESSHGKSNMALTKGNYFGIGAFNSDPDLAFTFITDDIEEDYIRMYLGLYNGAKWVKENYFENGQNTLNKMLEGKIYAQLDDGSPNYHWRDMISYLME